MVRARDMAPTTYAYNEVIMRFRCILSQQFFSYVFIPYFCNSICGQLEKNCCLFYQNIKFSNKVILNNYLNLVSNNLIENYKIYYIIYYINICLLSK